MDHDRILPRGERLGYSNCNTCQRAAVSRSNLLPCQHHQNAEDSAVDIRSHHNSSIHPNVFHRCGMAWSEELIKVSTAGTSNIKCLKIIRFMISLDFPPSIPHNFVLSRRVLFWLFNINLTLGLVSGSILVRKLTKKMWLLPAAVAVIIAIQTICFYAYLWSVRVKDPSYKSV